MIFIIILTQILLVFHICITSKDLKKLNEYLEILDHEIDLSNHEISKLKFELLEARNKYHKKLEQVYHCIKDYIK